MARRRRNRHTPNPPKTPERKPPPPLVVVGLVVAVLVGLVAVVLGARLLARQVAAVVFLWADGDYARVVAFLLVVWALGPFLVLAALRLRERHGRVAAAPAWVVVGALGLMLLGFIPGKHNNGSLQRELTSAAGAPPLSDTGDVFVATALAALVCLLVVATTVFGWVFGSASRRPAASRLYAGAAAYVVAWVAAGAIVVSIVGDSPARITWLETTADVLAGGDDGITGEFQVGLDASVLDVVDCDTARDRLRVDGREPELDGCRRALLVAGVGRYDRDGTRTSSGRLVAVVVQVRTEGQLDDLDAALDDVTIQAGGGLPEPRGDVLATKADAALALVIAAEDPGDLPLPEAGSGRRPLTRALAYVMIGTATGFYLAPPEETPAVP
ncbi:hypothetical protein [Nocardioides plantarum]|uniref:Uncharacterized protein n=1 Tax=Nocardioides plantarum TaxID=29299 RepID=A0ABV5KEC8_9ACTN|nr:hypothetical protein [Nocardioides plantarum]